MRKRNKTIAIRCTEDEYNRMHRRAAEHGMKLSDFVLRTALGKKIIIVEGLQDVVRQQRAIGNNLNQLTRLANQGGIVCGLGLAADGLALLASLTEPEPVEDDVWRGSDRKTLAKEIEKKEELGMKM